MEALGSSSSLQRFQAAVRGDVVYPDHPGYAQTTRIWNGMIKRRPGVVVYADDAVDVQRTVDFCRENGVELSIKGGGHNIAGLSLSDGGITLDLARLRHVELDIDAGLVSVGPGCTLGEVDRATQAHGLATTLGFVSETGVAGLALGGGFGYLTRRFGWTVDDLEQVEIVTADSAIRTASRGAAEDLFWAIRGGGGNFGVVTDFVFRVHPVGPVVTAGVIAWPASQAQQILELFRLVTTTAPRELTTAVLMRNAPPAAWLPVEAHGAPIIAMVVCHTGSLAQAESDLASIRSAGRPIADAIRPTEYAAHQSMFDATQPKGLHQYWKSEFLGTLDPTLLDTCRAQFDGNSSPSNQIVLFHIGGALNTRPEDDGAVGNRDAAYVCIIAASWPERDPAGGGYREWVRDAWQAIKPYSTGGNYVNFQTDDDYDERIRFSYRSNHKRLRIVKAVYDPDNLFHVNRNIVPADRREVVGRSTMDD
jgi:FAD/FMN-containing dehydrogenase